MLRRRRRSHDDLVQATGSSPAHEQAVSRWVIAAILAGVVLQLCAVARYRFDNDELQHLHVAWELSTGSVQYRDVFDNHTPLLHMLYAPALGLFGASVATLYRMRVAMLPLFAASVLSTAFVAARVAGRRVAATAVSLLVLYPPFLLHGLEFRNDNLQYALWMLAVAAVAAPIPIRGRSFLAGLFLGAALAASIKAVLLVIAIVLAAGALARRGMIAAIVWAAAGFAIVPSAICVYFLAHHAFQPMIHYALLFNFDVVTDERRAIAGGIAAAIGGALLVVHTHRRGNGTDDPAQRAVIGIGAVVALFGAALLAWPIVEVRTFNPIAPLVAILAALRLQKRTRTLALILAVEMAFVIQQGVLWRDNTRGYERLIANALRLTHINEPVLDLKGEVVFRHRPVYEAFEMVTRSDLARHKLVDRTIPALVRTPCFVAVEDSPFFPPLTRAFLAAHYLDVGTLRVAGEKLGAVPGGQAHSFEVAIPGPYTIVDSNLDALNGTLDGVPFRGRAKLAAGVHTFIATATLADATLVWSGAIDRGFSPYTARDDEGRVIRIAAAPIR